MGRDWSGRGPRLHLSEVGRAEPTTAMAALGVPARLIGPEWPHIEHTAGSGDAADAAPRAAPARAPAPARAAPPRSLSRKEAGRAGGKRPVRECEEGVGPLSAVRNVAAGATSISCSDCGALWGLHRRHAARSDRTGAGKRRDAVTARQGAARPATPRKTNLGGKENLSRCLAARRHYSGEWRPGRGRAEQASRRRLSQSGRHLRCKELLTHACVPCATRAFLHSDPQYMVYLLPWQHCKAECFESRNQYSNTSNRIILRTGEFKG